MLKFTENGMTALIEAKPGHRVDWAKNILSMCASIDDVQRCASMGDFSIVGYDVASAVVRGTP